MRKIPFHAIREDGCYLRTRTEVIENLKRRCEIQTRTWTDRKSERPQLSGQLEAVVARYFPLLEVVTFPVLKNFADPVGNPGDVIAESKASALNIRSEKRALTGDRGMGSYGASCA